jgi:hypothetical protein
MKHILGTFVAAVLLLAHTAYAGEVAVLLPVVGPLTPFEQAELSKDAVEVFSARFDVKHGAEVDSFVKQVFQEESKKNDCDEANCYRRIAAKYHADKIIALRVAQVEKGRYLVTSHLYDVPTGEMTSSQKQECAQCSFDKLKALCKDVTQRVIAVK